VFRATKYTWRTSKINKKMLKIEIKYWNVNCCLFRKIIGEQGKRDKIARKIKKQKEKSVNNFSKKEQ
jgi:transcription antitermination factor NusA-like protein